MARWKDISSFSQGEKDRTPVSWELRPTSAVRLTVHRHISTPGAWHLSCEPWFSTYRLRANDIEAAKRHAIEMVREQASALLAELRDPD